MSLSFEALVIDNVREFGILDTVRALRLYGYTGRRARIYIERLLREHTTGGDDMLDRYLVQFLRIERDPRGYWVTDCAFQEGQLDRAIAYVNMVLEAPSAQVSAGLVLDQADGPGTVHYQAGLRVQTEAPMYEHSSECPWNRNQSDELEELIKPEDWDRCGDPDDYDDPPAWACGQDPERCETCGALIGEDLRCPRCDAADELESRLQAIVSEARETGGEL